MKIDTSTIENYDSMTAEEKLAALESYEMADPDYSGYVKKDLFDKKVSELARKNKELTANMSEEELKQKQREEAQAKLQADYESLLKETNISKATAKYLSLGYDEKLAAEAANALVDGDTEALFATQQKAQAAYEKSLRASILKDTPKPTGNGDGNQMTKESLAKMSSSERIAWAMSNENEYKTIIGGNE